MKSSETQALRVEICWGDAAQQQRVSLAVAPGSTLDEALFTASLNEEAQLRPPADFVAAGILGQRCNPNTRLRDGDRIELYRALQADPKDARRERVSAQRRQARRAD